MRKNIGYLITVIFFAIIVIAETIYTGMQERRIIYLEDVAAKADTFEELFNTCLAINTEATLNYDVLWSDYSVVLDNLDICSIEREYLANDALRFSDGLLACNDELVGTTNLHFICQQTLGVRDGRIGDLEFLLDRCREEGY